MSFVIVRYSLLEYFHYFFFFTYIRPHIPIYSFQNIRQIPKQPENNKAMTILKTIRKIEVPLCLRLLEDDAPAPAPAVEPITEEPPKPIENKNLSLPDRTHPALRSRSKSPKNRRLANMILGSNNTSKEKGESKRAKEKNEREKAELGLKREMGEKMEERGSSKKDEPIIFTENDDLQELGSPCSVTPFLFPNRTRPRKRMNRMVGSSALYLYQLENHLI